MNEWIKGNKLPKNKKVLFCYGNPTYWKIETGFFDGEILKYGTTIFDLELVFEWMIIKR